MPTVVFDGETKRTLNEGRKRGYIGPKWLDYVHPDEDYATFYVNEVGEVPLVSILRGRKGTKLVRDNSGSDAIVLNSPPEKGSSLAAFGYTLWLDAEHGLLPKRIEVTQNTASGEIALWRRMDVRSFFQLEDGAWVPTEVVTTTFVRKGPIKGAPSQEAVVAVNLRESNWNKPIADSVFELAFPPGVEVLDDLRRVKFVTGNQRRETNVDKLIADAQNVVPNPAWQPQPPPSNATARWLIALNVLFIISLAAAIVAYRAFRRGAA